MTEAAEPMALGEIVATKIEDRGRQEGVHLAQAHFAALKAEWQDDSKEAFAFRLLCIAALYTNDASSHVFGTETESPNALRTCAAALRRKVHELDAGLLPGDQLADWVKRLKGQGDAFQCTSVLHNMQSTYLNGLLRQEAGNGQLHRVRDEMIPLEWR